MTAQPSEPPGNPQLGALIREQIVRRRFTIDGLAGTLGVHRSTLSRWLAGTVSPSPVHLAALEESLGVTLTVDADGYATLEPAVDPAPVPAPAPQVVVLHASTAEAVEAAFTWLGVPRAD